MLIVALGASVSAWPSSYWLSRSIGLGAPDRWDYLAFDPESNRVYVAHGDRVTVVDGAQGRVIGEVTGIGTKAHGVVLIPDLGKGYTDDGEKGVVVSFDLKTLTVLHRIKAQPDADGIAYDPVSRHVFVSDGDSGKVTVIDPKSDTVVATIYAGGGLEFGVADGKGSYFVNGAEKAEIIRIDTRLNHIDARWSLPDCVSPHGLAMDRVHDILFATCVNQRMMVIGANDGRVLARLPIGAGTDFAEFDPERQLAFSSNREGTLSVIAERSPTAFVSLPPVVTALGARTMALDPKTGRLYLVTATPANTSSPAGRHEIKPGSVRLLALDPAS